MGLTAIVSLCASMAPPALADEPANNNLAGAQVLGPGLPISVTGSTSEADFEAGEPSPSGSMFGSSVWFRLDPETTGAVRLQTCTPDSISNFPIISVYRDKAPGGGITFGDLDLVADNSSARTVCGRLDVPVTAGESYRIRYEEPFVSFVLTIRPHPANDDFAAAMNLGSASPVSVAGDSTFATVETNYWNGFAGDESPHEFYIYDHSLWYRWQAPSSARTTVETCTTGSTDTRVAVYTGSALTSLDKVAEDADACPASSPDPLGAKLSFRPVPGTDYRFQVDDFQVGAEAGPFTLSIRPPDRPPGNDAYPGKVLRRKLPLSVRGTNIGATAQPGEPHHSQRPPASSVWYSWKPVVSQTVDFNCKASDFPSRVAVYRGGSVKALRKVGRAAGDCRVSAKVAAGNTYRIAMDTVPSDSEGNSPEEGKFTLRIVRSRSQPHRGG